MNDFPESWPFSACLAVRLQELGLSADLPVSEVIERIKAAEAVEEEKWQALIENARAEMQAEQPKPKSAEVVDISAGKPATNGVAEPEDAA